MIKIDIKKDCKGILDLALKKYKNKINSTNIIGELKERKEFTKKSVKRRKEKLKAKYIQNTYKDKNE
jgi:small subunit ribosomal protein S21